MKITTQHDQVAADLGEIQALAQKVDADQHVQLASAEPPDDLQALQGLDLWEGR